MKHLFTILFAIIVCNLNAQESSISGKIKNLNNVHDTNFKIVFLKNTLRTDSGKSRSGGLYLKKLKPGTYDLQFSIPGYLPLTLRAIQLNKGENHINFTLSFREVQKINLPIIPPGKDSARIDDSKTATLPLGSDTKLFATPSYHFTPSSAGALASEIKIVKTKAPVYKSTTKTTAPVKAVKAEKNKVTGTLHRDAEGMSRTEIAETKTTESIKAGQITAGHWRDLEHWEEWLKTNSDFNIQQHQKEWEITPLKMLCLKFKDADNQDLVFTDVTLLNDKKEICWQTKTDEKGRAYFWPTALDTIKNAGYCVQIKEETFKDLSPYINKDLAIKVNFKTQKQNKLEIGFVVDATGSMGDEIQFLQAELMDVINRVRKKNQCLDISTGSVFYRDHGDQYLTRVLPLSNNPANTIDFIGDQQAGGGGDFPEAVDYALQDAVNKLEWTAGNHPKMMFLLLDAPPHQSPEVKTRLKESIRQAAALGIRIIPITASGINKSTEFLMKYMAILTNGEYLYITDDSKIGSSHLKPTGGESKVDYLNDIMVDLINRYSKGNWCQELDEKQPNQIDSSLQQQKQNDSLNQNQNHNEIVLGKDWYMRFYPNPAAGILNVIFSEDINSVRITDLSGKEMYQSTNANNNALVLNVSEWSTGVYIVYAQRNDETISGKLLVMH